MSEPVEMKDIRNIQPDRLIKYRISEDRFSGEVLLPGLWYTDFDKFGGKWLIFSLSELCDTAHIYLADHGYAFYDAVKGENTIFAITSKIEVSNIFHGIQIKTHLGKKYPVLIKVDIVQVGNSSFTQRYRFLQFTKEDAEIAVVETKAVLINLATRKTVQFPDWFKSKWSSSDVFKQVASDPFSFREPQSVPSHVYRYKIKALHSDGDANDHVQHNVYIKWILSAVIAAKTDKSLNNLKINALLDSVRRLDIQYIGEVFVTDSVVVDCWENQQIHLSICL